MTAANPLLGIESLGQSIWIDYISRPIVRGGELARRIQEDHLRGVTSNPAIFQKAISSGDSYNEDLHRMADEGLSDDQIYEALVITDIQEAADLFRGTWEQTGGEDGYVSLEVSPHLAHDTAGTIEEARSLWSRLDRPNVMIKVPGTEAGLPAVRSLIAEGINVNITLLFAVLRYEEVIDAYLAGLEDRLAAGGDLSGIASVASFFLSRIDVKVDPVLQEIAAARRDEAGGIMALRGRTAIASARIAYERFLSSCAGERWEHLRAAGARPQRLLWASTSTKNPDYDDVMYVEALIGPRTVNTLPIETLDAYRDHGDPALRLQEGLGAARDLMQSLAGLGIDIGHVTDELESEGVQKFIDPFDRLLATIAEARQRMTA